MKNRQEISAEAATIGEKIIISLIIPIVCKDVRIGLTMLLAQVCQDGFNIHLNKEKKISYMGKKQLRGWVLCSLVWAR